MFTIHGGQSNDLCGISVGGLGDVNQDGVRDVLVGAYTANLGVGLVQVISGADATLIRTIYGDDPGDLFGCAVAGAGDVNRDGFDDIVIGAFRNDAAGLDAGSVRVVDGHSGATLYTFYGAAAGNEFGAAVAAAGDVNRDGYADVIVGAALAGGVGAQAGSVSVYSGRDGTRLHLWHGDAAYDWFGYSVAGLGDIDRDGHDDVIVGVVYADLNGGNSGGAKVFSGRTGEMLRLLAGSSANDWFGSAVSGAGDINRDGYPDILVGASTADANGRDSGAAYLFSGRNFILLRTIAGARAGEELGASVASGGDVDGDGQGDLLLGAYRGSTNGTFAGSVYVHSGRTGGRLISCHGDSADDRMGVSVANLGDLDGDGRAEFAAGAVYDDDGGGNAGSVRVFSGAPLLLRGDVHTASLSNGGTQQLFMDAGKHQAGKFYWLLGSASGTQPGTLVGQVRVPLNYDTYMQALIDAASGSMPQLLGQLDAQGRARLDVVVPANSDPSLIGLRLHHAYIVYDAKGRIRLASNATPITLVE